MTARVTFALALVALVACSRAERKPPPPQKWVGGIQVNEPDHLVWGTTLKSQGLNTVEVTVYAKQGDWNSSNLWYEEEELAVLSEMRMAKTLGLQVVLVLRVALDHAFEANRFLWHGMIMPASDEALDEWFVRYRAFVEKWAVIAEREKVDVLAIASEMSSLTNTKPIDKLPLLEAFYLDENKRAEFEAIVLDGDRITPRHLAMAGGGDYVDTRTFLRARADKWAKWAHVTAFSASSDPVSSINRRRKRLEAGWRDVIRATRERYRGKITYAANFDQYEQVGFWDAFDLIGINAYFGLRDRLDYDSKEQLRSELRAGWTNVLRGIDGFRKSAGVPNHRVLFTELGYTRRRGATVAPWASTVFEVVTLEGQSKLVLWADRPHEDTERAEALAALADVTNSRFGDMFAGVLYWKLSTIADHRAIEPFVLPIDPLAQDPMLGSLQRFSTKARSN